MANEVKTPIQNYFEKVLYENLTFQIPPLWFLEYSEKKIKIVTSPCGLVSESCHESSFKLIRHHNFNDVLFSVGATWTFNTTGACYDFYFFFRVL
jgi:hypothetical protein